MKDIIKQYESACKQIAEYFRDTYFDKNAEMWWVGRQIGGVLHINDYFFSIEDMLGYLKYKYSHKKMFEHYEYALKCIATGKSPINIKNYKKMK